MANVDTPQGFRPVANLRGGGEYIRTHIHAAADGVAIGKWDLVTPTGAADTVEQYDSTDAVMGVALNYVAASTLGNVSVVYVNHTTILEAQEDSDAGAIAAASEGLNCDVIVAAANTTTGISAMELNSNTAATTATLDMRLLQPSPRVGNVVASNFAKWFCSPLILHIAEGKAGI